MTIATLHTLCRYRDAVVPASLRGVEDAPEYERTDLCDFLFFWLEHDPADPITFYTLRMDVQPLTTRGTGGQTVRGGAGPDSGSGDVNLVMNRIFDVLDRMVAVNAVPTHIGNWDPGKLRSDWFSASSRGVVNREAALATIRRAIAEDKEAGRLPALEVGNLEKAWGYPPSTLQGGSGAGASLEADKGRVWPKWAVPEHYREFDYDKAGSVLLRDPDNYLGSSTFLARMENLGEIADRFEEDYPVEFPRVEFTEDVEVRFERRAVPPATGGPAAEREPGEIDVFVKLQYEVKGVKDLVSSWVGEMVYWDQGIFRISASTGQEWQQRIPLLAIEACTFDDYPYELLGRGDRRGPSNRWGSDGAGDDWGTRVLARDITQEGITAGCRSCVETELHFRIPASLASSGSLDGACTVQLYGHAPREKKFQVPVARVDVGRVKRGGHE